MCNMCTQIKKKAVRLNMCCIGLESDKVSQVAWYVYINGGGDSQ